MTNNELISYLEQLPGNAEVIIPVSNGYDNVPISVKKAEFLPKDRYIQDCAIMDCRRITNRGKFIKDYILLDY